MTNYKEIYGAILKLSEQTYEESKHCHTDMDRAKNLGRYEALIDVYNAVQEVEKNEN